MVWHVVQINCDAIVDDGTFHQEFAAAFGFPKDYLGTREAWMLLLAKLDDVSNRVTEVYCGCCLVVKCPAFFVDLATRSRISMDFSDLTMSSGSKIPLEE